MKMFQLVQHRMLMRSFSQIYLKMDSPTPPSALYLGNHSSWWDGLLLFQLEIKGFIPNFYVMTDQQGMEKVPIFKWIGAYSVDAQNPKHIIQSLRYTEALLQAQKNVCIFPQGAELHLEQRPLQFQQGAAMIVQRMKQLTVVPVTFYYTFRHEPKAEAWIVIGAPILYDANLNRGKLTEHFEQIVTNQLNELKTAVIENNQTGFQKIL